MEENEFDNDLRKITDHFGIITEITKLSEECGEFLGAAYKMAYTPSIEAKNELTDECADVFVILSQILLYFNVDMDSVNNIFDEKVSRTIKRINDGWYDKHR